MSVGVDKRWTYYALNLGLHLFASDLLYDAVLYAEITIHWLELVAQDNGSRKKDLAIMVDCATTVGHVTPSQLIPSPCLVMFSQLVAYPLPISFAKSISFILEGG